MTAVAVALLLTANGAALAFHDAGPSGPSGEALPAPSGDGATPLMTAAPPGPTTTTTTGRRGTASAKRVTPPAVASAPEAVLDVPLVSEGYAYKLSLVPTCGTPGTTFTATLTVPAKHAASGSVLPVYADGTHEQGTAEFAKPDGTVTYTWVAKPAYGEGRLLTQSRDPETGNTGTQIIAFRIVETGKPC